MSSSEDDAWSEENIREAIELWKLNAEDVTRLRHLGEKLKDVRHSWNDPHVVLGYMTGSAGYKNTEQNFRKMVHWRLQNDVDSLLKEGYKPNPLLLDYTPVAFLKDFDKDGDPIYVERGGAIDALGMLKRFKREELDRYAIWLREVQSNGEWIRDYQRRQGRKICEITVVYDLKGLSHRHMNHKVISWFKNYMEITGQYYPGPIKRMIVIRAPAVFRAVWKAVKHCFSPECRQKMVFAGAKDHLEVLSRYIDLDVLPSCINPDGKGQSAIDMPQHLDGGKIPDNVGAGGRGYVRRTSKEPSESSSVTDIVVEEDIHIVSYADDKVEETIAPRKGRRMFLKVRA